MSKPEDLGERQRKTELVKRGREGHLGQFVKRLPSLQFMVSGS